jgi:hypothetical protein
MLDRITDITNRSSKILESIAMSVFEVVGITYLNSLVAIREIFSMLLGTLRESMTKYEFNDGYSS